MTNLPHSKDRALSLSALGFGSRTGTVIATCVAIATAHALGARWLSEPFAMLPAGLWIVGFAWLLAHALEVGAFDGIARMQRWSVVKPSSTRNIDSAVNEAVVQAKTLTTDSIDLVRSAARNVENLGRRVIGKDDHELRIGLDMTSSDAAAIMLNAGNTDASSLAGATVRFERSAPGLVKEGPNDAERFDALLRRGSDGFLYLFVPERRDAPAAWAEWTACSDISFTSVFPVRLDASRVKLGAADLSSNTLAALTARLAIAAAALGRTPSRIGNTRGFAGRTSLANFTSVIPAAITSLADALVSIAPDSASETSPCCQCAARVISAFLATSASDLGPNDRLHLMQAAGAFVGDEPEAMLRLGAVQMSCGQSEAAETSFARACRTLRGEQAECMTDPAPFVMGEAELGGSDRLSFGRVCAGLALLCATSKPETLAYIHDDLIDDLRHAGWDIDRKPDLDRARRLLEHLGAMSTTVPAPVLKAAA